MKATIIAPDYEDLKNLAGMEDYFSVDVEKFRVVEFITMSIGIYYEAEDGEELPDDLPGHKPTEEDKPTIKLKDEVIEWLKENITGKVYSSTFAVLYFEKEQDAVLFKIRWDNG